MSNRNTHARKQRRNPTLPELTSSKGVYLLQSKLAQLVEKARFSNLAGATKVALDQYESETVIGRAARAAFVMTVNQCPLDSAIAARFASMKGAQAYVIPSIGRMLNAAAAVDQPVMSAADAQWLLTLARGALPRLRFLRAIGYVLENVDRVSAEELEAASSFCEEAAHEAAEYEAARAKSAPEGEDDPEAYAARKAEAQLTSASTTLWQRAVTERARAEIAEAEPSEPQSLRELIEQKIGPAAISRITRARAWESIEEGIIPVELGPKTAQAILAIAPQLTYARNVDTESVASPATEGAEATEGEEA